MQVTPLSPSMGAIITGIDLSNGIEPEQSAEIRALWLDYQLIVIRGQKLMPAIQLEIARAFGEPDHYPFLKGLEGYPEITPVLKREDEAQNFGGLWHTDTIYQPSPPMATMLYALELPPIGGDTLFANQYMAYEHLSDGLRQALSGLKLISRSDNKDAAETRAARIKESGVKLNSDSLSGCHPAIRTHPETGRKSLYISPAIAVILKAGARQKVPLFYTICILIKSLKNFVAVMSGRLATLHCGIIVVFCIIR